ncbi:hypothetical protein [Candidatus Weimeria sp. HCP3S3_B5]|uniref:hypothetical protein n=1 Tax=Candidatus Weimeria sp. HCP3S3_B5 TaxID=3438871 RepID=UPI003F8C413B
MDASFWISIIVAIVIGGGQIYIACKMKGFEERQDKRDETRRKAKVTAQATQFIQKYNSKGYASEILLLPLCVSAYKYNPIYHFHREIYREFCSLTEEVQNEILSRSQIELSSQTVDDYYTKLLDAYKKVQSLYCPNDLDIFYDEGKYLERALINNGNKIVPSLRCAIDEEKKRQNASLITPNPVDSDYMPFHEHITNELAYNHNDKPIARLFAESTDNGSAQDGDEIIVSYLCCVVAKYVSIYAHGNDKIQETGNVDDFSGKLYMEDLFLDALNTMETYNS